MRPAWMSEHLADEIGAYLRRIAASAPSCDAGFGIRSGCSRMKAVRAWWRSLWAMRCTACGEECEGMEGWRWHRLLGHGETWPREAGQ